MHVLRGYSLTWDGAAGTRNGMPLTVRPDLGFDFDTLDTRPNLPVKTLGGAEVPLVWAEMQSIIAHLEEIGLAIPVSGVDADGVYHAAAPASLIVEPVPGLPAAPNGEVWRWSGGAWGDARTAEELAIAAQAAKTAAKEKLAAQADHMARAVTGIVPLAEQLSWPVKEAAARAHQAGTADAGQAAILAAEADVTGETVDALVEKILANAVAYHMAAGFIAGWRRKTMEAIDLLANDATVEAGIATIATQAAMEAEAALAALG